MVNDLVVFAGSVAGGMSSGGSNVGIGVFFFVRVGRCSLTMDQGVHREHHAMRRNESSLCVTMTGMVFDTLTTSIGISRDALVFARLMRLNHVV